MYFFRKAMLYGVIDALGFDNCRISHLVSNVVPPLRVRDEIDRQIFLFHLPSRSVNITLLYFETKGGSNFFPQNALLSGPWTRAQQRQPPHKADKSVHAPEESKKD